MGKIKLNRTFSTFSKNQDRNRANEVRRDTDTIKTPSCTIYDVDYAIIGRDQNILQYQQKRIRDGLTLPIFLYELEKICTNYNPKFLSYKLLYLYKADYLKSLNFNIPVAYDSMHITEILESDANTKYIHSVPSSPLDDGNKLGIIFKENPLEDKKD